MRGQGNRDPRVRLMFAGGEKAGFSERAGPPRGLRVIPATWHGEVSLNGTQWINLSVANRRQGWGGPRPVYSIGNGLCKPSVPKTTISGTQTPVSASK